MSRGECPTLKSISIYSILKWETLIDVPTPSAPCCIRSCKVEGRLISSVAREHLNRGGLRCCGPPTVLDLNLRNTVGAERIHKASLTHTYSGMRFLFPLDNPLASLKKAKPIPLHAAPRRA